MLVTEWRAQRGHSEWGGFCTTPAVHDFMPPAGRRGVGTTERLTERKGCCWMKRKVKNENEWQTFTHTLHRYSVKTIQKLLLSWLYQLSFFILKACIEVSDKAVTGGERCCFSGGNFTELLVGRADRFGYTRDSHHNTTIVEGDIDMVSFLFWTVSHNHRHSTAGSRLAWNVWHRVSRTDRMTDRMTDAFPRMYGVFW